MLQEIAKSNDHVKLDVNVIPQTMALEFFRFLWEITVSEFNTMITIKMSSVRNDLLRSSQNNNQMHH